MKIKKILAIALALIMAMCTFTACSSEEETTEEPAAEAAVNLEGKTLMVYCGAGMKEPFQKIADTFTEETGCTVNVTFGNAAQIQTQINTTQEGDMFIAGSAEELKPVADSVESSIDLAKHIPVIAVQSGNPQSIAAISDLASVDVIMGDPEATPIGKVANKIFTDAKIADQVNIVATTTTAPPMVTAIQNGEADAAIVWKENVKGDGIEIAEAAEMDAYIKTIPAASLTTTADADTLAAFVEFLQSETAQNIWIEFGYELAG